MRLVRVLHVAAQEGLPVGVLARAPLVVERQPEEDARNADARQVGHQRDGVEGIDEVVVHHGLDVIDLGQADAVHDEFEDVEAVGALLERVVEVVHPGGLRTAGLAGVGALKQYRCTGL